jgi:thiol-disulfide isomerase/thioredoxin
MIRWYLVLASLLAVGPTATLAADPLTIGRPAPALQVGNWVKGEPVGGIEKGKVHVVEFWATSCVPCIKCLPHLTDLQRKHPAVIFVALSPEPEQAIRDFVAKHDKDMGFRVGVDAKVRMWKAWMEAADLQGIPTAFIVDAAGRIGWIGNAAEIDEPLRQIIAGTFEPQLDVLRLRLQTAANKQERVETDRLDRYNTVAVEVEKLIEQRKWTAALAAVEGASRDPKVDQHALRQLKVCVLAGNPATAKEAIDYAVDLAAVTRNTGGYDSISHSRSYFYLGQNLLRGFETSPDPRLADLAIAVAEWAVEDLRHMTGQQARLDLEYEIHQLQARAHASRKRYVKAVSHQELALALLPKVSSQNRIKNWRPIEEAQLKAALEEYKKGLAGARR